MPARDWGKGRRAGGRAGLRHATAGGKDDGDGDGTGR